MKRLHAPGNGWFFLASLAAFAIGALATFAAHAFTLPTSSTGPGQFAVSITAVTALQVPQFAAAAEICVEGGVCPLHERRAHYAERHDRSGQARRWTLNFSNNGIYLK
jgi:hypothetical protein